MQVYKVGGAIRDELMGHKPKDIDWVVVGETPQSMLDRGYRQVGADFPVFLNPLTGDEYALARVERKSGVGYSGFQVRTDDVSLEDDLGRRDLTVNSMARNLDTGELIDLFGGQEDIRNKVLRHVGPAFSEDPLRVLRVARFAARYPDFTVADETMDLMKQLVISGELEHLTPERVWVEMEKALGENTYERFVDVLQQVGALDVVFPELNEFFWGDWVSANEFDVVNLSKEERFATLMFQNMVDEIQQMGVRLKIPNSFVKTAAMFAKVDERLYYPKTFDPWDIIQSINLLRNEWFIGSLNRLMVGADEYEKRLSDLLIDSFYIAKGITFECIPSPFQSTLKGPQIGETLDKMRKEAINAYVKAKS